MKEPTLTRRDLTRLALAALGGLASGAVIGCGPGTTSGKPPDKPVADDKSKDQPAAAETPLLLQDKHVCRGINTCTNKGKKGTTNSCAGQGHCATAAAHSCQGMNDCKGQGGCDGKKSPGENECKGKGNCEVPLTKKTWPLARARFEELMKKAGKKFSDAPAS